MDIHFYLDNEEETPITSMYDLSSNPFKLGDEISIDVEELYPADYNKYRDEVRVKMIADNSELEAKFRRKKVKITKECKYVRFKVAHESKLTIEYHCVYSKD